MKSENVSDKNRANKNLFFYKKNEKRKKYKSRRAWSNKKKDKISKTFYLIFKTSFKEIYFDLFEYYI